MLKINRTPNKIRKAFRIAREVRQWAENNSKHATTKAYFRKENLDNMSAVASAVLFDQLKREGVEGAVVHFNGEHCFVAIDDTYLIDVTATQFEQSKIEFRRLDNSKKTKPKFWFKGKQAKSVADIIRLAQGTGFDNSKFWSSSYVYRALKLADQRIK